MNEKELASKVLDKAFRDAALFGRGEIAMIDGAEYRKLLEENERFRDALKQIAGTHETNCCDDQLDCEFTAKQALNHKE